MQSHTVTACVHTTAVTFQSMVLFHLAYIWYMCIMKRPMAMVIFNEHDDEG